MVGVGGSDVPGDRLVVPVGDVVKLDVAGPLVEAAQDREIGSAGVRQPGGDVDQEVPDQVTLPEYRALVLLARTGGSRVVDLAGARSVNPSTVSRTCERLLRKGMVSRTSQESDRRAVRLTLTETGRALVDEVTRARTVEIEAIVARVSPANRAVLVAGFQAFADAAGEVGDDLWPTATLGWLSPSAESPGPDD